MSCDLDQIISRVKNGQALPFFNFLLRAEKEKDLKGFYMGKGVIVRNWMNKGLLKHIFIERFKYFHSFGYKLMCGLLTHPGVIQILKKFGSK